MSLTIAQIRSAQATDADATRVVLEDMEERITRLAAQAARRLDGDNREDFEQDAREVLIMALPRFDAETVDAFYAFMYSTIQDALKDKVRAQRYQGVDKDAVKVFMSVMAEAEGDPYKAERLAQTLPGKGLRLSAERANAARLAWQGAVSIDKGSDDDETGSLADTLVAPVEPVAEIRPKVGTGAALEALGVLQRYSAAYGVLNALPGAAEDVDAIEDAVTLPREASARRAVLDACAILRSYVSTATDGDLAEDLRDESDERKDERAGKIGMIRSALDRMGKGQRDVLTHSFGVAGALDFGWGDGCDMEGLCEALGITYDNAKVQRSKARVAFAKYFIALVAISEADAIEWATAAAEMRKPAGRK